MGTTERAHARDPAVELAALTATVASREAMLATMHKGIVLFGADGAVRYSNPAAVNLLGGRFWNATEVTPPALRAAVDSVLGGEQRAGAEFETTGSIVEATVTAAEPAGAAILVARDVTAARRTEQLRRDFVDNASHELKTPVSSIVALVSALSRSTGDSEATTKFVAMLEREAERLSALVSDLLDLSRLENSVNQLEPLALDGVVRSVTDKLRPRAADAGLDLVVGDLPVTEVAGREPDLELMLHNLLDNAIRYTLAGGAITVTLEQQADTALLAVGDTGTGIPEADLPRVFERFYRVGAARDTRTGGTGLGLAIVRHVAESHRGTVDVASAPRAGSTFTVTLPLARGGE
jgi:two-component system sensor histidine kinase SenX3